VIGCGIIGCSVAWRLAQTGRQIALLERGQVGDEASSAAGGLLCPKAGPGVSTHLPRFWQGRHQMYPAFVEEVRAATGHSFECRAAGQIAVAFTDADVEQLRVTFRLQRPAGINATWLSSVEALVAEPTLAPDVQAVAELIDTGYSSIPVEKFRTDRFRAQV
jgi:glycine oxidase